MFTLTKQNDPRCIEYYNKAFPHLSHEAREAMRTNWIKKNLKKKAD